MRKLVRNRYGEIIREEIVRRAACRRQYRTDVKRARPAKDRKTPRRPSGGQKSTARPRTPGRPNAHREACAVALDVQTGAVLVAAGVPRFDFGPSAIPDAATWKRLSSDPRHPLFHRAVQMALPPGSVFKVLSAVALLESRRIDPDLRYECRGYLDQPDRLRCLIYTQQGVGHGPVDLKDAMSRSCNVYFFHAAGVMGSQPLVEWARRFGIGRPTGVDLPFEQAGNLPEPDFTPGPASKKSSRERRALADTRALAIGQSSLTVTPLQVARVMAAIANGGYLVTPFVAKKAGPQLADDDSAPSFSRGKPVPGLSEGTLARVRAALVNAVALPTGTGYKTVRSDKIAIAGKTGTAQVGASQPDHAWFAGYARPSGRASRLPSSSNTPAPEARRPAPSPASLSRPFWPKACWSRRE